MVHRDVSPHNVFLTYDGQVKVLDFGIAKSATSTHENGDGVVKGKVTYMAPEQVAFKRFDRRSMSFRRLGWSCEIRAGERLWKGNGGLRDLPEAPDGGHPPTAAACERWTLRSEEKSASRAGPGSRAIASPRASEMASPGDRRVG